MHKIMNYVCKEMEDLEKKIEKNGGLNPSEMQYLDTLAHVKKNLLKAEEMGEESERGSYADGSYRGSYEGGSMRGSYRGGSYRSYAEPMERGMNDGYSGRRDRMGRYSREGGYSRADSEEIIEELREMMGDLPANKQRQLQQLIQRHER